jgi:hypothetical protein
LSASFALQSRFLRGETIFLIALEPLCLPAQVRRRYNIAAIERGELAF